MPYKNARKLPNCLNAPHVRICRQPQGALSRGLLEFLSGAISPVPESTKGGCRGAELSHYRSFHNAFNGRRTDGNTEAALLLNVGKQARCCQSFRRSFHQERRARPRQSKRRLRRASRPDEITSSQDQSSACCVCGSPRQTPSGTEAVQLFRLAHRVSLVHLSLTTLSVHVCPPPVIAPSMPSLKGQRCGSCSCIFFALRLSSEHDGFNDIQRNAMGRSCAAALVDYSPISLTPLSEGLCRFRVSSVKSTCKHHVDLKKLLQCTGLPVICPRSIVSVTCATCTH